MLTMRFICFKTMEFSNYICSIAGTKFVRSSRVFVSICGESHQVLHLCGVSPRATSWLRILRLSHSPLNPDYKHYRLCSCGLSQTETHFAGMRPNQSSTSGYAKFHYKYSFERTDVHIIATKRTHSEGHLPPDF